MFMSIFSFLGCFGSEGVRFWWEGLLVFLVCRNEKTYIRNELQPT